MKRVLLRLFFVGVCVLNGCSVKESRTPCPCLVSVDMSRFGDLYAYDDVLFSMYGNSRLEQVRVPMDEYGHKPFEIEVRGRYATTFCGAVGYSDMICRGDTLYVRENKEYPPLWTAFDTEACDDDTATVGFIPHKDYTLLVFSVGGLGTADNFPYKLRVRAGCNGISMRYHTPVKGSYEAFAGKSDVGNTYQVRVPRQDDYEMTLEIITQDNIDVFELGALMFEYGYDWTKDDLDDILVSVDFSKPQIELSISNWQNNKIDEVI